MPWNFEDQIYREVQQLREHQKTQRVKKATLTLSIALVIGLGYWVRHHSPVPLSSPSPIFTPEPSFPPVPLPDSGVITAALGDSSFGKLRLFLNPPTEVDNSKLKDECSANTLRKNKFNYFLKVVDWELNQTVMTVFIRAGEKVTLNLPAGSYKLRYAAGEQWYGEEHLFGPKTRYGEVSELMTKQPLQFKFERRGASWDLGLYGCNLGGNTSSKTLKSKDF